jgi:hypothetical protein
MKKLVEARGIEPRSITSSKLSVYVHSQMFHRHDLASLACLFHAATSLLKRRLDNSTVSPVVGHCLAQTGYRDLLPIHGLR